MADESETLSAAPSQPLFVPDQDALRDKLIGFLVETWGAPGPPCPYCRRTTWAPDAEPVLLSRVAAEGGGVPVFLIWCTTCGNEVHIAVSVTGLWEDVFGTPEPDQESEETPKSVETPTATTE